MISMERMAFGNMLDRWVVLAAQFAAPAAEELDFLNPILQGGQ